MDLGYEKCILCQGDGPLTSEHVIPDCIGGSFKADVLCRSCNSGIGAELVAGIYHDPSVRLAVEQIRDEVPDFIKRVGTEKFYFAKTIDDQLLRLSKKGESERVLPAHKNGELAIQDVREMPAMIKGKMKKAGLPKERIQAVMDQFHLAGNDQPVIIPEINMVALKKAMPPILEVNLSHKAKALDPRLIALIAFEITALAVGDGIYDEGFIPIREYIIKGTPCRQVEITPYLVRKSAPLHYLNLVPLPDESAIQIDVVFFESFVHRVKFRSFTGLSQQIVFEEDLKANSARFGFRQLDSEDWEWGWLVPPNGLQMGKIGESTSF